MKDYSFKNYIYSFLFMLDIPMPSYSKNVHLHYITNSSSSEPTVIRSGGRGLRSRTSPGSNLVFRAGIIDKGASTFRTRSQGHIESKKGDHFFSKKGLIVFLLEKRGSIFYC